MTDTDFEILMAYADGELDAAQARDVEARLASDPEARAMVERFRQTRADVAPLNALLDEPVPQRLIDTVRHHPISSATSSTAAPSTMPPKTPPGVETGPVVRAAEAANAPAYWPRVAAAACLAMAVGLSAGHWWGQQSVAEADVAQVFQRALQTVPSGETLAEGEVQVMPLASFQVADGQVCREYEQASQGRLAHGVACLMDQQWVARVVLDRGPANGTLGEAPAFAPASGEADALALLLDRMGAGAALGADEEHRLIEAAWLPAR